MDEIEKAAREQLMIWSGQLDALTRQREIMGNGLAAALDKISDPVVKTAINQVLAFVVLTDQINGLQSLSSSLDHLLQNHNDDGIEGRHGYH